MIIIKTLLLSATLTAGMLNSNSAESAIKNNTTNVVVADDIKLINDVKKMRIKFGSTTKTMLKSSQSFRIPCKSGLVVYEVTSSGSKIRTLFEVDDYKNYCGKEIKLSKILD